MAAVAPAIVKAFLLAGVKKERRVQRKKMVAHFESVFGRGGHAEMGPGWRNEIWRASVPSSVMTNCCIQLREEKKCLGP